MDLKNNIVLITGGTGSFGMALANKLISTSVKEIRIFSRDEKKQDDMRKFFNSPKLKFYIGDVRDIKSLADPVEGVDYLFHAAALKQVPSCEFYPMEAFKTNVLGTENVIDVAILKSVKSVICLSTDKAVYPINAMGISKAMMEKVVIAKSRNSRDTNLSITRYGNVMASRGSVIPLFINQITQGKPITITDYNMTRFMMTLDEAVDLVFLAFEKNIPGAIFVQKSPASSIKVLLQALTSIFSAQNHPVECIGTRHGEKLFEIILSREEVTFATDLGDYFVFTPDERDLNYSKYFERGEKKVSSQEDYNSHNTRRLSVDEMKDLLLTLPEIKSLTKL